MAASTSSRRASSGHIPSNNSRRTSTTRMAPSTPSSSSVQPPQMTKGHSFSTSVATTKTIGMYVSDPDEIFTKRTIAEVRAVLHKVKFDADAKQEELRLMVGERYRDLLQASTSIIEISQLSKNVHQLVSQMETTTSLQVQSKVVNGTSAKSANNDDQLHALQCIAAHVKLLIDASEHLWRFLERRRYLHAAWLFLLCRVVHRSLVRADEDNSQSWMAQGINVMEQFPLVQRQWDSLTQFRAQISHKATLSLRDQAFGIPDVCGTILALHLLDSLPFMDGLDLLLKQRTRSLTTILGAQRDFSKPVSSIKVQSPTPAEIEVEVLSAVRQSLEAISCTIGVVRHAFQKGSPPFLLQILQLTQVDGHIPESIPPEIRISTPSLLASLPGGTIFSSLPPDIKAYRPFIDVKSSSANIDRSNVSTRLRSWLVDTCTRGKDSFNAWLRRLTTIEEVWKVNQSTYEWLSRDDRLDDDDKDYIQNVFNDVSRTRVGEIFLAKLEDMSTSFTTSLDECLASIREGSATSDFDLSPSKFLLSAPPSPSLIHSGIGPHRAEASLQRFRLSIKHRIDSSTPLVESLCSAVEAAAKSLRSELNTVSQSSEFFSPLQDLSLSSAERSLGRIVAHIEHTLSESIESDQLSKVVFCGRIAHIFSNSLVSSELSCSDPFKTSFQARASENYVNAVNRWAAVVSSDTAKKFTSRVTEAMSQSPSRPSPMLAGVLVNLTASVTNWGFFRDREHRSYVAERLLDEFANKISKGVQDLSKPVPLSLIWDLHFVRQLCGAWGESLAQAIKILNQRIREVTPTDPPSPVLAKVEETVSQSISQMSLLLAPILPNPPPLTTVKSPKSPTFKTSERRSSTSRTREAISDNDFPVLALAKPSSRFGSLWVSEQ
ncbi:hypothetical protein SCHPADRAFT_897903 [Schizopora paradoxa]|uniref:Conserved oligomeric Golgi complex subunit 1 n=1 Tax=Schizopora paradoxa TaxID=27342 RepID=A0A0H2SU37_9AGAM|nr:hypothetical protein SCHPADRAFT_897903 [Schizopora paradoxa]